LLKLTDNPENYDAQEKARVIARYCSEYTILQEEFRSFAKGESGHNYLVEYSMFFNALDSVINNLIFRNGELSDIVTEQLSIAKAAIDAVPVPNSSVILEAGTPFSTYCKLKSLCEVDAVHNLVWIDAYMASTVFYRYLSSVRPDVIVVLVTSESSSNTGRQNRDRWTEFLDVSRLFAQERGDNHYRLILNNNLHDRWIVFDNKRIYSVGGSAKDAANKDYFTITSVEPSLSNLQSIQTQIDNGREYFGINTTSHL
jgi:hypothetical protein